MVAHFRHGSRIDVGDFSAEGIETDEQADLLRSYGCPFGQGYQVGRPAPLSEIADVLSSRSAASHRGERPRGIPARRPHSLRTEHREARRDARHGLIALGESLDASS